MNVKEFKFGETKTGGYGFISHEKIGDKYLHEVHKYLYMNDEDKKCEEVLRYVPLNEDAYLIIKIRYLTNSENEKRGQVFAHGAIIGEKETKCLLKDPRRLLMLKFFMSPTDKNPNHGLKHQISKLDNNEIPENTMKDLLDDEIKKHYIYCMVCNGDREKNEKKIFHLYDEEEDTWKGELVEALELFPLSTRIMLSIIQQLLRHF